MQAQQNENGSHAALPMTGDVHAGDTDLLYK
jgi:hypothetical protein